MAKNRLDTGLLLSLTVSWLAAVVVYVAYPLLVARFALPLPAWIRSVVHDDPRRSLAKCLRTDSRPPRPKTVARLDEES